MEDSLDVTASVHVVDGIDFAVSRSRAIDVTVWFRNAFVDKLKTSELLSR